MILVMTTPETVLKSLQNKYPSVVYYNNSKIGLGSAISLGINKSQKKYLVIFMADMSDDINDLIKYHEMISKEFELYFWIKIFEKFKDY